MPDWRITHSFHDAGNLSASDSYPYKLSYYSLYIYSWPIQQIKDFLNFYGGNWNHLNAPYAAGSNFWSLLLVTISLFPPQVPFWLHYSRQWFHSISKRSVCQISPNIVWQLLQYPIQQVSQINIHYTQFHGWKYFFELSSLHVATI